MEFFIIQGATGSGKTFLANCIERTHEKPAVWTTAAEIEQKLYARGRGIPVNLSTHYSMIVVDECSIEQANNISTAFDDVLFDVWTRKVLETEGKSHKKKLSVFFLITERIDLTEVHSVPRRNIITL